MDGIIDVLADVTAVTIVRWLWQGGVVIVLGLLAFTGKLAVVVSGGGADVVIDDLNDVVIAQWFVIHYTISMYSSWGTSTGSHAPSWT